jgi:hypothetical protein
LKRDGNSIKDYYKAWDNFDVVIFFNKITKIKINKNSIFYLFPKFKFISIFLFFRKKA